MKSHEGFPPQMFPIMVLKLSLIFYLGKQLDAELQKYLDNAQISLYPARAIIAPYPKQHMFMILLTSAGTFDLFCKCFCYQEKYLCRDFKQV